MPVDPRMFAPADIAGIYHRGQQAHQQREQYQNQRRLGDLLPKAVNGDTSAMEQIAHIDPRVFMQLNQQQREQANAELNDLASAVRWADTPEKWQRVQQYYAAQGHDVSQYPFEARESALVQLGKIGEYLKSAPQAEYKTLEPGGSLIDVSGGRPRVVIAPNDGSYQTGQPVQGAGIPQGAADMLRSNPSLAPQFDEKYGPGAAQRILGGQTASPSGGFPGSGYGG